MSQFLIALAVWLHNLASVIFIGYFVLAALIYLPALQSAPENLQGMLISALSRHSRAWLYGSLLVFAITGSYLTFIDPNYMGLGNFGNPWAILMLLKHIVVLAMIVIGFWFNAILRVGPMASSTAGSVQAKGRFHLYANFMAVAGILVLLLTAFAQAE